MNAQFPSPDRKSKIESLLLIEAKAREALSLTELQFLIANETRKLIPCRQIVVHRSSPIKPGWRIEKVSSISQVDRTAPMIRYLETAITSNLHKSKYDQDLLVEFTLSSNNSVNDKDKNYPFKKCVFISLKDKRDRALGGISFLSERNLSTQDKALIERLASTYAHAWSALKPVSHARWYLFSKKNALIASLLLILAGFIPVPLTVLAPVEIVAREATLITAPIEGVIENIHVSPNKVVTTNEVLFSYNALDFKNNDDLATRNMAIANARFRRSSQSAFGSGDGRRELAITKAEYEVAVEEKRYSAEQLSRVDVRAPRGGVILFSSKDEWIGRPVSIGERIMRVADPEKTEFKIKLPVGDAIILEQDITARIFLDSAPLNPVEAIVILKSYTAEQEGDEPLSFPVIAQLSKSNESSNKDIKLRIGLRGTAQISGQKVPLAFNLFKKPLSAIRQYLGI